MNNVSPSTHEPRTWKAVYTIVERPGQEKKKHWVRIGTAFTNRDSSLNVLLDANPVNGQIHIRDIDEEELERARQRRAERASHGGFATGGVQ